MADDKIDILVGTPLHGMKLGLRFTQYLHNAIQYAIRAGYAVAQTYTPSSMLPTNRNTILREAIKRGAKWCMMFDADQSFPEDVIVRLIKHEKPIVSGLYFTKTAPYRPLALKRLPQRGKYTSITKWKKDALIEVDAVGAGVLLIETDAAKRIPQPWFSCPPPFLVFNGKEFSIDKEMTKRCYATDDPLNCIGEDIYFCELAKARGFKILIDTSLPVGHEGDYTFTEAEWELAVEQGWADNLIKAYEKLVK